VWKLISILVLWGLNLLIIYSILLDFVIFSLISVSLIPCMWKFISISTWGANLLNFVIIKYIRFFGGLNLDKFLANLE